jgi:hypothetical protein
MTDALGMMNGVNDRDRAPLRNAKQREAFQVGLCVPKTLSALFS